MCFNTLRNWFLLSVWQIFLLPIFLVVLMYKEINFNIFNLQQKIPNSIEEFSSNRDMIITTYYGLLKITVLAFWSFPKPNLFTMMTWIPVVHNFLGNDLTLFSTSNPFIVASVRAIIIFPIVKKLKYTRQFFVFIFVGILICIQVIYNVLDERLVLAQNIGLFFYSLGKHSDVLCVYSILRVSLFYLWRQGGLEFCALYYEDWEYLLYFAFFRILFLYGYVRESDVEQIDTNFFCIPTHIFTNIFSRKLSLSSISFSPSDSQQMIIPIDENAI